MRVAAIGDIHCNSASYESMPGLFAQIGKQADMLLLCGDIVDYGLPEEAVVVAKEISNLRFPSSPCSGTMNMSRENKRL